jgi:hypothetical protein
MQGWHEVCARDTRTLSLQWVVGPGSFITYRSCKHLDRKHTIFGKVVGGIETLDKMEAVEADSKDRPKVRSPFSNMGSLPTRVSPRLPLGHRV